MSWHYDALMAEIRVGNAPCSWGLIGGYEATLETPYAQVLDEMAAAGYAGTELGDWGYLPTDPEQLSDDLARRDLAMIGGLVPVSLADRPAHTAAVADALRTARLLAAVASAGAPSPLLVLADTIGSDPVRVRNAGRIAPEDGLTGEQWSVFGEGAGKIARAVRDETGLRTVFHHHCAGYVETPGETARLMELTDAAELGLCFDTGHWALGGGDVLEAFDRYRERIWHVHFKEYHAGVAAQMRSEGLNYFEGLANRVFHRPGTGDVDFPALLGAMRSSGYEGWVVVEDELPPGDGDPEESARADRAYLQSLGL